MLSLTRQSQTESQNATGDPSSTETTSPVDAMSASDINTAVIVGATVGAIVLAVAALIAVAAVMRHRQQRRSEPRTVEVPPLTHVGQSQSGSYGVIPHADSHYATSAFAASARSSASYGQLTTQEAAATATVTK
jgi:hypothetical protein